MIIAIASGKGGTGKTSVATNLALSLEKIQILDCDVEEPNIHLFLKPKIRLKKTVTIPVPIVNEEICDFCGKCADFCQYNALFVSKQKVLFLPELCHSCGGCLMVCPRGAIKEKQRETGTLFISSAGNSELVYGELKVGEPMAIPVIHEVKKQIAEDKEVIIDSPPGTSCPFVETVKGSDFCILVTEPTPFGLHDLKITVKVLEKIKIPFGIIVNRAGIGDNKVYEYCRNNNIQILLEIPFQRKIAELYSEGIPYSLKLPEWKKKFQTLFNKIKDGIGK
jgi:MinD superfamily P-loop ATPase